MKVLFILIICITTSCARRYPVDGLVIAVRPERHEIVISHREVEGLMPAMIAKVTGLGTDEIIALSEKSANL